MNKANPRTKKKQQNLEKNNTVREKDQENLDSELTKNHNEVRTLKKLIENLYKKADKSDDLNVSKNIKIVQVERSPRSRSHPTVPLSA